MMKNILLRIAITLSIIIAGIQVANAAGYPERAVTIIVPFSAGGNTDTIARIAADQLSKELGQPVIIENRGGGGGTVGSAIAAKANPDGYTLLFATAGSHSVNPILRKIKYDPIADFDPISTAVISSVLIVVNSSVEAKNIKELTALTVGDTKMNFASGGVGTLAHVAGEIFNKKTGSSMVHVPYKGSGNALNDLLAGRVHVFMNNIPSFISPLKTGAVRALALAAKKRSALLPGVPTTAEAGLDDMIMGSWYGLVAPRGTPPVILDKLYKAMKSMSNSDAIKARYAAIGTEITISDSPEQFGAFMKDQLAWWRNTLDNPMFRK